MKLECLFFSRKCSLNTYHQEGKGYDTAEALRQSRSTQTLSSRSKKDMTTSAVKRPLMARCREQYSSRKYTSLKLYRSRSALELLTRRPAFLWLLVLSFGATSRVRAVTIEPGAFTPLAHLGRETKSNDEPSHILTMADGTVIVGGTSSPQERLDESDLGTPLVAGLRQEDFFLAKINAKNNSVEWTYRGGTSREDRMHAMILTKNDNHLYIAGRTFGQFSETTRKGQSDIFIIKYDVSGAQPVPLWPTPLLLGTSASDAVTDLAVDPKNENVVFACGFTRGTLFPGREVDANGLSDAIIFSFDAADGSLISKRQFGSEFADHATGIVLPDKDNGPLFVSVITERQIGQYAFGNFHMYKFKRVLSPLGDLLLRTYSREQLTSFQEHPILPNALFGSGSSWLDTRNGYDVFVKKVVRVFDESDIGSHAVDIDEVEQEEYTKRIRSEDGSHDYASGMVIDPETGRLIICGYTAGAFAPGSTNRGILAPFLAAVDPTDASLTDAKQIQMRNEDSWAEIASITMVPGNNGIYYAAKESNETTNQFYLTVGSFGFPALWKTALSTAVSQEATPSPTAGSTKGNTSTETKFPLTIVIACVCGGLLLILAVVALAMCISMKKRHRENLVYDPQKPQRQMSTRTPGQHLPTQVRLSPLVGQKVQESNATGLV